MFNDVQYMESSIIFRKAYGIGVCLEMTYEELSNCASSQNESGCVVVNIKRDFTQIYTILIRI